MTDIALVIDPDPIQAEALRRALLSQYREVLTVSELHPAIENLLENDQIGLVVVDVGGVAQGIDLAGLAVLKLPTPIVIATHSELNGADGFRLGKMGVRRVLAKPFTTDELLRAIADVIVEEPPQIVSWVAPFLGRVSLFEFETDVRRALVLQAVLTTDESRSAAARLLRAPRPVIQRAAPPQTHHPRRRRR
jgi:DNA-binding response OmpR family regulator